MRRQGLWVALLAALALGLFVGYSMRRWNAPALEERAQDAAKDLRKALERLTR